MAEGAKTEFLSLKVPAEQLRVIEQHAVRLGVSKSAIARMLLSTGSVPTFEHVVQR